MNRSTLILLAAAVVSVVGLFFLFRPRPLPVEAARATYAPIHETVDERGKTRLPKTHLITMPYSGRIEALALTEGAAVKRDQIVARMVDRDVELINVAAEATVDRLGAAIYENDDTSVESTGLQQSLSYVDSMNATVNASRQRVRAGKAKHDYAKKHLDRVLDLRNRGASSPDEEDQARLQLVEADASYQQDKLIQSAIEAMQAATTLLPVAIGQYIARKGLAHDHLVMLKAEAQVERARVALQHERSVMRSPIEGVVLDRLETNERHLSAGTELLKIGDLNQLEVEADVLSQEVVNVQEGDRVEIYGPAIGPNPAAGVVDRIYPAGFTKVSSLGVEQQRVKAIVRFADGELARLRSQRGLGVDYRVGVRIVTDSKDRALVVPRAALFRGYDGGWNVYAVRDGAARLQRVDVGLMNDETVEIVTGLSDGETVVLSPETQLTDGTLVAASVRD